MIKITSLKLNDVTEDSFEYEKFVSTCENSYFMQSCSWAKVKNGWTPYRLVLEDENKSIKASIQILIKEKKGVKTAYAPRGPVCETDDLDILKLILKGAIDFCKSKHVIQLKIDPLIVDEKEKIAVFKNLGFSFIENMADYTTIQPRGNYLIENLKGKTQDDVLMSFKQKTRYNIKVALKHGVECKFGDDDKILDDFFKLLKITAQRDGFQVRDKAYYRKILDMFKTNARIYVCYHQGDAISGAFCINYAKRTYYVFGASDNSKRNLMPTYLMQWEMIKWAIETGCNIYDFMGIPATVTDENDSMVGVLRFKKGFNGSEVIYCGEFNYNFNPLANFALNSAKKYYQILTRLKNKIKK